MRGSDIRPVAPTGRRTRAHDWRAQARKRRPRLKNWRRAAEETLVEPSLTNAAPFVPQVTVPAVRVIVKPPPSGGTDQVRSPECLAYADALSVGDGKRAERIALGCLQKGMSLAGIYSEVIGPAMTQIGDLWTNDRLTLAEEHRATAITERVMATIYARSPTAQARAGRILLATLPGQRHTIGLRMASDVIEQAGYEVTYLGADVPLDSLIGAIHSGEPDLLVISATFERRRSAFKLVVEQVCEEFPELRILVGGQGMPAGLAAGSRVIQVNTVDGLVGQVEDLLVLPSDPGVPTLGTLATIVDSAEDAIVCFDLDEKVTSWNQAAETFFGIRASEAIGNSLAADLVPNELVDERQGWIRLVKEGKVVEGETMRLRRNGDQMFAKVKMLPLREDSEEVVGVAAILRDITDSHIAEALRQRDADGAIWRGRIESALEVDGFLFAAQPIVEAATGAVDHHELLLRMRVDDRLVSPGEFLPEAEESGLIRQIDTWVVQNGIPLAATRPVSLNLSARSFNNEVLVDLIKQKISDHGVEPAHLTFEITETAAADDLAGATRLFDGLAALGCKIALDDFGTGFGTFTYLQRLPATELKIDMSFVREIGSSKADRRIVEAMIGVARNFGMRTVAEGVENEETLVSLRSLGVDLIQGYLFGRPCEVDETWGEGR